MIDGKSEKMAITIKDVAAETGLAISTISKYMNGGNVREENKKRIKEAVNRLGYLPNSMARGLRSAKTYTVGLLVSFFDDEHMILMSSMIEKVLQENGYFMIICCYKESPERAKSSIDFLLQRQVDGVILEGYMTADEYTKPFETAGIPVVCLETLIGKGKNDAVVSDGTWGSYCAVEDMIARGHTRIGIITGPKGYYTSDERLRGYYRVLEDYRIPVREEYIIEGDYTYNAGLNGLEQLWKLKKKPTGVFISNYFMCIGAVAAINRIGIKIPDDLSIVSYDDMELSLLMRPNLSAVKQPFSEMGEMAASILIRRMNDDYSDFPRKIRLKSSYIMRDSVGRPKAKELD